MRPTFPLPYGTADLDAEVHPVPGQPRRVRCYVRGCSAVLRTPTRRDRGELCPVHGVRCHWSLGSSTYSYWDVRRNIIASPDLFASRLVGHPFKYESHRLAQENSEDALSWNVFRSLQEAGQLHEIARWITGQDITTEPLLFLWGIGLSQDIFQPWNLLIEARERFENNLPVSRPLTEPDIALFLPGRYLVLIEAKFTSPNTFYANGPRKDGSSLTKDELLNLYHDPGLRILDWEQARTSERVYYQLWRNMIFAEWMASRDGRTTMAYHVSLTRAGAESDSCDRFRQMVRPEYRGRFVHIAWEDIYWQCAKDNSRMSRLQKYLENKTAKLTKAFRIDGALSAQGIRPGGSP
jgi:hypothetical protein